MNVGDIWGATNRPKQQQVVELEPMSVKECALLIHHKLVSMQDQFNTDEVELDHVRLRETTGMTIGSWKAIVNLDIEYFENRPLNQKRLKLVASAILELTNQDWLNLVISNQRMKGVDAL
ncbi:hypothetical protein CNR34_00149 [Pseudomonas phage nickie]|uniref:Uncharacterized protein n=1 Tax=Pseudomonas phage nickie TaxID=2048977 RepID=A0A2H4P7C2_9CAUD|nr:hypothetical protein FDJ16_gp016 [Pseudomonas phage nickie]ATW58082.1 hypothetical protein CNR34_00149 [Pseudomonas phage nickie]